MSITKYIAVLIAVVLPAVVVSSCVQPRPSPEQPTVSWQSPADGQTVFGIVKPAVSLSGGDVSSVEFYIDEVDPDHMVGVSVMTGIKMPAAGNFECTYPYWYTQDAANGNHVIYALAKFSGDTALQTELNVTVHNGARADSIPLQAVKMTPENDPAPPRLSDAFKDAWYDPVPVEGPINTAGAEDSPFITPNGNTFYFWFNGDENKEVTEQTQDPATGIYVSQKENGIWREPERIFLQYFDKLGFDGAPTLFDDTLWFASIREGNYRGVDMWTADLVDGKWTNWSNAGELLNKEYEIGEIHFSADGSEMYFNSIRDGGKGQADIWATRKVNERWQEPENIAVVNSAANEGQPYISEDGNELWFTRDDSGPEIYRSLKENGEWLPPELVVSSLAGEPTLDSAGNLYFTHHRWDSTLNRVTEADIYVCYRKPTT